MKRQKITVGSPILNVPIRHKNIPFIKLKGKKLKNYPKLSEIGVLTDVFKDMTEKK